MDTFEIHRRAIKATRIGLISFAVAIAGAGWAAQTELEPGSWKLKVSSTINGKPEPVQDSEECLGDELKDLAAYFAPSLEGAKAQCKRAQRPTNDPRKLAYRIQCSGSGFTMNADTSVTIESPRRFTGTMRIASKTKTESAVVLADIEGNWTGPCKPGQ